MESLAVAGGTHLSPTATVRLRRAGEVVEDSAMGDGMIDAVYGAIVRATGVDSRLVSFNVSAVSGGSDALGGVVVQLDVDGRLVTGRGVSADVVEASARAYLAAINRAFRQAAAEDALAGSATEGVPV
jgi:2-isopropylmalate synthase